MRYYLAIILATFQMCDSGPPRVEDRPILLNSFIPAGMQVIAHLTDLMKYDLKPQKAPTTTTTLRPTPPHKPGLYAPDRPLGPQYYFGNRNHLSEQQITNYFTRYKLIKDNLKINDENLNINDLKDLDLFGKDYQEFIKYVNKIDGNDDDDATEEENVKNLLNGFDDSNFGLELLRKKRIPPTRAYVTLLSLYDQLNKESKRLNLNKYGGYAENVLRILINTSDGTSANQLNVVLSKIVERRDTDNEAIIKKINPLLIDLSQSDSYIHDALRYIPPLQFAD